MEYLKELKIKYVKSDIPNPLRRKVENPEDVYLLFKGLEHSDKEKVVGIYLDARMMINGFEVVSIGGSYESYFSPKEIFKGILLTNSVYFIVVHNHPSGNPEPSPADRRIIKKLETAAHHMDVRMRDFIIIGDDEFWSWKAGNYFRE